MDTPSLTMWIYLGILKGICLFYVHAPECMYVHHIDVVPLETKRGCHIPWNWVFRLGVSHLRRVLETRLWSSKRAASAFRHPVISSALHLGILPTPFS